MPATHFWCQIKTLETQNVSYFPLSTNWYGFWNYKSLFVNVQCRLQWEKLPAFSAFPVNIHWLQAPSLYAEQLFSPAESPIGQFKFHARQPYARLEKQNENKMVIWQNSLDWVGGLEEKIIGSRSGRPKLAALTVRTSWPRAKYFPVQPFHSVNKYSYSNAN